MPSFHSISPASKRLSLLDTRALSATEINSLFERADVLAKNYERHGNFANLNLGEVGLPVPQTPTHIPKVIACLFFEASTRTLLSFQSAAYRLGHNVVTFDIGTGSSMLKGETEEDTVLNVAAMKPDALVIRYNRSEKLDLFLPNSPIPVISAGTGTQSHPTQALLDAYTIRRSMGEVKGQRVLIVGDIVHSRVARSNFDVLTKLGAEVGICGPEHFLPKESETPGIRIFHDLDEALSWPTVYMGLRVQTERHGGDPELRGRSIEVYREDYHSRFGLSLARAKKLSTNAIILHPGPINHGVEFAPEIVNEPRSRVFEQVANGVLIRAALLARIFSEIP